MNEINLLGQPLAERALRAALARPNPPQQLLFFGPSGTGKRAAAREVAWRIMDPTGAHHRRAAAVDLIEVRASGDQIRLEELDPALSAIAARPQVMERRVLIIDGAERLRAQDGSSRILKPLEEPGPRSHVILITERSGDLLPTIRSRCLPVPFRTPGAEQIAQTLTDRGMDATEAAHRARAEGPAALAADDFDLRMATLGRKLAIAALVGDRGPRGLVNQVSEAIEDAASHNPSAELLALQQDAAEKEGKRGARTAARRAEDQRKRELRRRSSDGWRQVLRAAAGVGSDALMARLGARNAARNAAQLDEVLPSLEGVSTDALQHIVEELERTVADLALNPEIPLRAEALLARISRARSGRPVAIGGAGRLPA